MSVHSATMHHGHRTRVDIERSNGTYTDDLRLAPDVLVCPATVCVPWFDCRRRSYLLLCGVAGTQVHPSHVWDHLLAWVQSEVH
jgi:hypothetical protein